MRHINTLAVIHTLRASEPLTLSAVAEQTGLSRFSAHEVVEKLRELGWVVEVPPSAGSLGRPARRYRFRADAGHVAGVDIGVHTVRATVADLDGKVLAQTRQSVTPETSADDRLAATDAAVTGCLAATGLSREDLWTVVAGTTGVIDRNGQVTISAAIEGWSQVDLPGRLAELFPCDIKVENDARLAALAEHERGAAQGANDVVFLHAGRRTGAALIVNGTVHRGFGGAAGEVGVHPAAHWGAAADILHNCPVVPAGISKRDAARHTFGAARAGDPVAIEAVERYADDLAFGASTMVLTLDPEIVVLGGGFSRAADVLVPLLRSRLEEICLRMPDFRGSILGEESVALGAVDNAVAHLNEALFGMRPGTIAPLL